MATEGNKIVRNFKENKPKPTGRDSQYRRGDGQSSREQGERKAYNRDGQQGERRSYNRDGQQGERRSYSRDGQQGERRSYSRDGQQGERKSYSRDGQQGERRSYQGGRSNYNSGSNYYAKDKDEDDRRPPTRSSKPKEPKVKEQQPDKFETIKRLEREQKTMKKKEQKKKQESTRPKQKVKRANNKNYIADYENGYYDDYDDYF